MNDQAKYTVTLEFDVSGADASAKNMREWQRGVDELARAGGMSTQEQNKLTRAISGTNSEVRNAAGSLPTLRYALYDVAQTSGAAAAAIGALGTATLVASASFESSFTAVERTSGLMGDEAARLREELVALTREIPQSFAEISNIAARGAQLGIASDQISEFTETVAQFVATSDTVTLDQAVEAMGRISNLLGDTDFNRIGSSITLVGVNAAATEAQIVKTTQELAPFATAVGMSTDEVIALAAALGSLGQPPERARSAFLTLQRVMDNAIASGSENLSAFAQLLGQTEEQVASLWKQDPGQFVESFADALGGVDDLTTAFANLGINERRAVQVFQALAADARNAGGGLSVLNQAMEDAARGYNEGTELARQYGLIVDDLASSWQFFLNSLQEFAASVGDVLAPAVQAVLDFATRIIQGLSEVTQTPFGNFVVVTTAILGTLAFVIASTVAAIALFAASMVAGSTALRELNATAGASIFTLTGLRNAFGQVAVSAGLSTTALRNFRIALASTGIGLAVVAVGTLAAAFMDLQGTAHWAIDSFEWLFTNIQSWTNGLKPLAGIIFGIAEAFGIMNTSALTSAAVFGSAGQSISQTASVMARPFQILIGGVIRANEIIAGFARVIVLHLSRTAEGIGVAIDFIARRFEWLGNLISRFVTGFRNGVASVDRFTGDLFNNLRTLADNLPTSEMYDFGGALEDVAGFFPDFNDEVPQAADNLDNLGDSAAGAAREVRTLVDYANDLRSVWDRAFEIRFSGQSTLDAITSSFISMREASDAAAKRIRDLNNDIRGLTSDISIQEYFLSIAIEYGDTKRAEAIEADLLKMRAELADKTADLQKEQDANTKSLVGNTKGAIDNRKSVMYLVQQYQAHIGALAASGMSSAELAKRTEELRQDFIRQLTQMGYNRAEAEKYAKAFDDIRVAIANVPRNITITANANPAITALKELQSRANTANNSVNTLRNNIGRGLGNLGVGSGSVNQLAYKLKLMTDLIEAQRTYSQTSINSRDHDIAAQRVRAIQGAISRLGYAQGGYTGRGGKYEPAGIVHRGEYVIPKHMVNQATGMPYADALGRLMTGVRGFSSGGSTTPRSSGVSQVALTPGTIQAIATAVRPMLFLDGEKIAQSSSNAYAHGNTVGAY